MSKRLKVNKSNTFVPFRNKRLDLRQNQSFFNFNAHSFEFGITDPSGAQPLKGHGNATEEDWDSSLQSVEELIAESADEVRSFGVSPYSIVHLYLHCRGMDTDFKWNGVGENLITLGMLSRGLGMESILEEFARIIQSNANVTFDEELRLTLQTFTPPSKEILAKVKEIVKNSPHY